MLGSLINHARTRVLNIRLESTRQRAGKRACNSEMRASTGRAAFEFKRAWPQAATEPRNSNFKSGRGLSLQQHTKLAIYTGDGDRAAQSALDALWKSGALLHSNSGLAAA